MNGALLLLVDDEPEFAESLQSHLKKWGHGVVFRRGVRDSLDYLKNADPLPDVLVLDFELHDSGTGLDLWERTRALGLCLPAIVISDKADEKHKKKIADAGALYWYKLGGDLDQFRGMVGEHARIHRQQKRRWEEDLTSNKLVGDLSDVRERMGKFAPTEASILILGETGTGKELVAWNLHLHSRRRYGPLVRVNCAAIPETLIESELFGYEKGAFTGALTQKKGRLEVAHEGTLLLDEVGDLSLASQAKLLRFLQENEFERLGATTTVRVDVRVISATNKDLRREIAAKRFREDLYMRLAAAEIRVPPLRERRDDIKLIAAHILAKKGYEHALSVEVVARLEAHTWPGNVRELENAVELACDMAMRLEREIVPDDFMIKDGEGYEPTGDSRPMGTDKDVPLAVSVPSTNQSIKCLTWESVWCIL
ncbi:sigma-54-dependent Fis family transcriptional regulator [candidate division WOR-3 bacterium]|uniref:Sigma-54-dependent Fis family transcriptional regulator n=1 Tax=candidate division WOR-3 bacterium TaxID=2052148 RepID=A0A938BVB1_UNCW3|nr:sigma-54-dependent Fis family transcriptional regulator [candidate division WOR-3 bacterium]